MSISATARFTFWEIVTVLSLTVIHTNNVTTAVNLRRASKETITMSTDSNMSEETLLSPSSIEYMAMTPTESFYIPLVQGSELLELVDSLEADEAWAYNANGPFKDRKIDFGAKEKGLNNQPAFFKQKMAERGISEETLQENIFERSHFVEYKDVLKRTPPVSTSNAAAYSPEVEETEISLISPAMKRARISDVSEYDRVSHFSSWMNGLKDGSTFVLRKEAKLNAELRKLACILSFVALFRFQCLFNFNRHFETTSIRLFSRII